MHTNEKVLSPNLTYCLKCLNFCDILLEIFDCDLRISYHGRGTYIKELQSASCCFFGKLLKIQKQVISFEF